MQQYIDSVFPFLYHIRVKYNIGTEIVDASGDTIEINVKRGVERHGNAILRQDMTSEKFEELQQEISIFNKRNKYELIPYKRDYVMNRMKLISYNYGDFDAEDICTYRISDYKEYDPDQNLFVSVENRTCELYKNLSPYFPHDLIPIIIEYYDMNH